MVFIWQVVKCWRMKSLPSEKRPRCWGHKYSQDRICCLSRSKSCQSAEVHCCHTWVPPMSVLYAQRCAALPEVCIQTVCWGWNFLLPFTHCDIWTASKWNVRLFPACLLKHGCTCGESHSCFSLSNVTRNKYLFLVFCLQYRYLS